MKIFLDSIGCRLNQSEIEAFARQFKAAGHTLVPTAKQADQVVVNTCAVTAAAASDSRAKIRQAARAGGGDIVVTGCWATLHPQKAGALPAVSRVVLNQDKDDLVPDLLGIAPETFDLEPLARVAVPGPRMRTRAFIKVQDGCDNHCTFCITTQARGPGRSRPIVAVVADVQAALAAGVQEVVLTGVHLGSWGYDLTAKLHLRDLVEVLLAETEIPRLRLSSLEPWDLDSEFFMLWQDQRLCRHLHLPLQSGCEATLRRMARKTTPSNFESLVRAARRVVPEMAITTDIIVGFPGESDAEFDESLAFVERLELAGGHIFPYSARQGTAAARMRGQVPHTIRKARSSAMRAALETSAAAYRSSFLNQTLQVLWESSTAIDPQGWTLRGLTDNYLRVYARAPRRTWNRITPIRLTTLVDDGLFGVIPDPLLADEAVSLPQASTA